MNNIKLLHYELVNDLLLLKWDDGKEDFLSLKSMRDNCPCANCSGETDVFGNIYKGPKQVITENSYVLNGMQPVGYYALRPFWADGHHSGIYSFTLMRNLSKD